MSMMISPWELIVLLFATGSSTTLPVGLPPTPDDPVIERAAPERCLAWISWNGMATPDPASKNRTERLLAEPSVREMVRRAERELTLAFRRESRGDDETAIVAAELPGLLKTLFTRPAALFVSHVVPDPMEFDIGAGLLVSLGDRATATRRSLQTLEALIIEEAKGDIRASTDGGWRILALPEPAPPVVWGIEKGYLVIGVGKATAEGLRKRIASPPDAPPAWLRGVKEAHPVARRASMSYIDVTALRQTLAPLFADMGRHGPSPDRILEALGIDRVESVSCVTGFDDVALVTSLLVATDGKPAGVLALVPDRGLTAADLTGVPADADLAVAMRLDAAQTWNDILVMVSRIDIGARAQMARGLMEVETELGFRIREDLLEPLGDVWTIYDSPGDGGVLFTALTAVVKVRDADRLRETLDKVAGTMSREMNRGDRSWRRYEFTTLRHEGERITWINPVGDDWVVAPAWCLVDDELVIAPYPHMVQSYISRRKAGAAAGERLPALPDVAEFLAREGGPAVISRVDTQRIARLAWPLVLGFATAAFAEAQQEGLQIDLSILPAASAVLPHIVPSIGAVYRTDRGIVSVRRETLSLPVAPILALFVGWMG